MRFEPKDRTVFITGASGGIGRACALKFQRAGSRVVAVARSVTRLQELKSELPQQQLEIVVADVTDPTQREMALRQARSRFGPIDVLINNAGWASFGSVLRMPACDTDRMWALNFAAPVALIQAVLPEMLERSTGQIINISSVVGYQSMPRMAVYCATKAALNSMSTALRMELRKTGIDVILIAPGSTRTGFFDAAKQIDTQAIRLAEAQYSAERVAEAVVRASVRRRKEVVLTPAGKTIVAIRRLSHRVADRIIEVVAKRAMPLRRSG